MCDEILNKCWYHCSLNKYPLSLHTTTTTATTTTTTTITTPRK